MSKFSKLCRREKNKWRRELEQYEQDKIDSERDLQFLDWLEEDEYWEDIDDYAYDDIDWGHYSDYDDWCIDDDWHLDDWIHPSKFTPGSHVQNGRDVYLVLETERFANLRTGEVVLCLSHAELIWGAEKL